jgi:hypothetical protein
VILFSSQAKVYFFLPSTDFNATVEEMVWTFGIPFRDHAMDRLRGLNPIKWEQKPGETPSNADEPEPLDNDAISNLSRYDPEPHADAGGDQGETANDGQGDATMVSGV